MAATQVIRGTANTALIPKIWSKKFLEDQIAEDPLKPFYGAWNIVTTAYDLKAEKGDTIEVPIVGLPDGSGVTDDGDYDSDIDNVALYNMPVVIHEHGRSLGLAGNMTEKSSALNARTFTMGALVKWRAAFNARAVIDALSGLKLHTLGGNMLGDSGLATAGGNQINCVTQVIPAYTAGDTAKRYYCGGETSAGSYTGRVASVANLTTAANYLFGPNVIEAVKQMARATVDSSGNLIDPIQPVNINGKKLYVMLISFKQAKALRNNTKWLNAHYYADIRGMENTIFSGQLGVYDGVMVVETDLTHHRYGENGTDATEYFDATGYACASGTQVDRALFLGANAVAWAWGKAPEYVEFYSDHAKTKWAARVTSIYGVMKVCKYSSTTGAASVVSDSEKGCIVVDTAVN